MRDVESSGRQADSNWLTTTATYKGRRLTRGPADQPGNAELLAAKNTQAREQLNSWISGRTSSGLEMTQGHFSVYWWALFDSHNELLEDGAACMRRRFAKGRHGSRPRQAPRAPKRAEVIALL